MSTGRPLRLARLALQALALAGLLALPGPSGASGPGHYARRPEVRLFIAEMGQKHGLLSAELRYLFARVRFQAGVLRAMTTPAETPVASWQNYRAMFVNPLRVESGAQFLEQHAKTLARAAGEFGVPPEIIVAIIGVETVYGRNMGRFRVIDALTTLAFDFPPRAEFFRTELENYLLYARDAGIDVFATRGSYAGAIGIPQFMPGSYRRYALDYDGDGQTDLSASAVDAIGSVANFLKAHGWEQGQPVALPAQVSGEGYRKLAESGLKPQIRASDLPSLGVSVAASLHSDALCTLIELATPGEPTEYRVGLNNFYVLTRYNRSRFYAAAVIELAQAIASEHASGTR